MNVTRPRYRDGAAPLAVAHRGGAGLGAENTLEAFGRAFALGVRYLETDIRLSADGVPVAFHDATLDRVTDGRGAVVRHRLAQLRNLRVLDGPGIPTLAEALDAFPDACFTVDLKDERAIEPLARVLQATGSAQRVCVAGAWDSWLSALRAQVGPELTTALGWRHLTTLVACTHTRIELPGYRLAGAFAHVPLRLGKLPVFGERLIGRAHRLGIRVIVWTVDDPVRMHSLLDAGVDGIITDRPDLLREVLIARGQWTAPSSDRGASPTVSDLAS